MSHVSRRSGFDAARSLLKLVVTLALFSVGAGMAHAGSLTTLFASNNGQAGNSFDLQPQVNLTITSFDVNLDVGSWNMEVWWRNGTASGFEGSSAGWTLLGTATVSGAGTDLPTALPIGGLALTAGNTYGFIIRANNGTPTNYTNGGPTTFSNADLSLTTYRGVTTTFGGTFFPRQWNGTVYYSQQVQYSESFTQGVGYCAGTSQNDNWGSFLASLPASADNINVAGSRNVVGYTCDNATEVGQILSALKNGTSTSVFCDSLWWRIDTGCTVGCSGLSPVVYLTVSSNNTGGCSCPNQTPLAMVRPAIGNFNWGGIDGPTCSATSQTMTVTVNGGAGATRDFGDAPAPYPTLLANNGARHVTGGPCIGTCPDTEADGQPSGSASGDDVNGTDDEGGGVVLPDEWDSSDNATVAVTVSNGPARLDMWMDFNGDGDWDDEDEQLLDDYAVVTGINEISVNVPDIDTDAGQTFARLRISTGGVVGPTGEAPDGEVEDYQVVVDDFDQAAFIRHADVPTAPKTGGGILPLGTLAGLLVAWLWQRRRALRLG